MSNEMLQKTIDLVSSLEVKNETQQIAKYELIEYTERLHKENQELKEQLDYLRSGEYLNQLRFERDMLQHVVDNSKVSKVDKEFIDTTHRNTELLAQQKEFIKLLENKITELNNIIDSEEDVDNIYYASARKRVHEAILSKYKEIIGDKDE